MERAMSAAIVAVLLVWAVPANAGAGFSNAGDSLEGAFGRARELFNPTSGPEPDVIRASGLPFQSRCGAVGITPLTPRARAIIEYPRNKAELDKVERELARLSEEMRRAGINEAQAFERETGERVEGYRYLLGKYHKLRTQRDSLAGVLAEMDALRQRFGADPKILKRGEDYREEVLCPQIQF